MATDENKSAVQQKYVRIQNGHNLLTGVNKFIWGLTVTLTKNQTVTDLE